jgi:hypothetical protein
MNKLLYKKTRKNGQVECVNVWETGWQELIVPSESAFHLLKKKVELEGCVPQVTGYA